MNYSEITKPGVHFVTEPIKIENGARICGTDSRLVGGVKISVTRVLDDGVCECDLNKQGITLNGFTTRGTYRPVVPSHSELFINSRPANISRYPKEGKWLNITKVAEEKKDGNWGITVGKYEAGFYYDDEHPKTWADSDHIWAFGFWTWDYCPTREHVAVLDKENCFVKNDPPIVEQGTNMFMLTRRFYFYNIREEVTEPGDFFLDIDANKVYFRPFEDTDLETAEIILSSCDKPVFDLDGAEDVLIEGFTIEGFRGDGIRITNSKNVEIRGCTIRNLGNNAVIINKCENVHVRGCHIYHVGNCGVSITSGDRTTLTPGNCSVEECNIHHVAAWDRTYEPPVRLSGVGNAAIGNSIHDCPHSAIVFGGNDHKMNGNEIYRVVNETGDAGAIYSGRNYTYRGNEICGNFIHHIGVGGGAGGTMAIYNDDCLSGTIMNGNVFFNVMRAIFMGGGTDFEVNDNVFIDCKPCIGFQNRGENEHPVWRNMVNKTMRESFYAINADKPPFTERYPELKKIDELFKSSEDNAKIPPSMHCSGNVFCSEEVWRITVNEETAGMDIEDNNIEVEREELRKYLTPRQISVVFDGVDGFLNK